MFETIKRLYKKYNNKEIPKNAVKKNWITKEQYMEIVNEPYLE